MRTVGEQLEADKTENFVNQTLRTLSARRNPKQMIEIIDRSMQSGNNFGGPKRFYTEPMFCYYREESLSLSHLYSFEGGRCPFSQPPTFHKVLESKKLWGHMAHNQLKIRGAESPLGGIEEERSRRKNQAL
ncbi:hypothetical protein Salat_2967200 [Sesamum alatum]|uniref:Uncharacterized protein n=1 Tax=Sesamum alatum TaxID=300844 RepID=A0AAE1XIW0_9LAMI|nr:hypothetical protein Salat_2967200 [Sesamum alatum]